MKSAIVISLLVSYKMDQTRFEVKLGMQVELLIFFGINCSFLQHVSYWLCCRISAAVVSR